jgi:hypothetical protein
MRVSLIVAVLLSSLLAACSFKGEVPPSKHLPQSGPLKVDPALAGPATPAK